MNRAKRERRYNQRILFVAAGALLVAGAIFVKEKIKQGVERQAKHYISKHLGYFDVNYSRLSSSFFGGSATLHDFTMTDPSYQNQEAFLTIDKLTFQTDILNYPSLKQDFSFSLKGYTFDPKLLYPLYQDDPVLYSRLKGAITGDIEYKHTFVPTPRKYLIEAHIEANPIREFNIDAEVKDIEKMFFNIVNDGNYSLNSIRYHVTDTRPEVCTIGISNLMLKEQGIYPNSYTVKCTTSKNPQP